MISLIGGFADYQATDIKSTGKNCLLVTGVKNSTNKKRYFLFGTNQCSNFQKTRAVISQDASIFQNSKDIYILEYRHPPTNTERLLFLTKTATDLILASHSRPDSSPDTEALPNTGLLDSNNLVPSFLIPQGVLLGGTVQGTMPLGVSVVDIQLTQFYPDSMGCYGLALFSNNMVSSWGTVGNNPFLNIPTELQGSCIAIRLSGTKAHGLKSNGKIYSWGFAVNNPITFNSLINPAIVEPDLTSYAFAEIPEYRKITHKDRSNRYRIFLDKDMAPNKTITELGLFIKNPNVDYKTDKPILAAYKVLDNPIQKTNEFEILIDWTITVVDQTE
jgi:hypothetical protein